MRVTPAICDSMRACDARATSQAPTPPITTTASSINAAIGNIIWYRSGQRIGLTPSEGDDLILGNVDFVSNVPTYVALSQAAKRNVGANKARTAKPHIGLT